MTDLAEYLQPWLLDDGTRVRGGDLEPDLAAILSLEEEAMPARQVLINLTLWAQSATLVGNPAPVVERMGQRLRSPRVGDLVVESSTIYWTRDRRSAREGDWYRAVGVLTVHRQEWWTTDAEWERDVAAGEVYPNERRPDDAWYIRYGPEADDICRWTNCSFIVVPWRENPHDV